MKIVLAMLLAGVLAVSGCVSQQSSPAAGEAAEKSEGEVIAEKNATAMEKNESGVAERKYSGAVLAGSRSPVLDFKKADYDDALSSNKTILLYFYADWCPICRVEVPELYAAFGELNDGRVVGFRVNFNDGNVDADERALAEKFGIPYQHTKVILKNGKQALKSPESWDKQRYLNEINRALQE